MGAGAVVEEADLRLGAAVDFALFDEEVLIGEGGDLRQVGDAEDLLAAAEGFELLADGFGGAAADADVDFVEDEGARGGVLLLGLGGALFDATLRASMTRDISPPEAISCEGLERLAGVGGDAVFDLVPAGGGPVQIRRLSLADGRRPRNGLSWRGS